MNEYMEHHNLKYSDYSVIFIMLRHGLIDDIKKMFSTSKNEFIIKFISYLNRTEEDRGFFKEYTVATNDPYLLLLSNYVLKQDVLDKIKVLSKNLYKYITEIPKNYVWYKVCTSIL